MNHPMKKKYDKNGTANVERVQNIWNFSCSTNFDAELHIYIKKRDFDLNFDKHSVKKLLPTTLFLSKYAEHFIEPISRNSWISISEEKLPEIFHKFELIGWQMRFKEHGIPFDKVLGVYSAKISHSLELRY
uniref:Uncharacterized protein n=1 Tax=Rhizophagus irregularis (strain DAOM 181602 / DAOM 197198 / MUCL 43194) TaxID=747089 RepID=U9UWP8_RHIID